jgi:hypothetical protein
VDRLAFAFDDERAVANAGLVLASTLAGRLGIEQVSVKATTTLASAPVLPTTADSFGASFPHTLASLRIGRAATTGVAAAKRWPSLSASGMGDQKNASVRISMLSRGRAFGGEVGSSNAVWAVQRARPSLSES